MLSHEQMKKKMLRKLSVKREYERFRRRILDRGRAVKARLRAGLSQAEVRGGWVLKLRLSHVSSRLIRSIRPPSAP